MCGCIRARVCAMFTLVGKRRAVNIVKNAVSSGTRILSVHPDKPAAMHIYNAPQEPCWYVYVSWDDGNDMAALRSSRVVIVSKGTGQILYDGSAGDEG